MRHLEGWILRRRKLPACVQRGSWTSGITVRGDLWAEGRACLVLWKVTEPGHLILLQHLPNLHT